jgi:hypothetical protein
VLEAEARELVFEQFNGLGTVHQPRIRGQFTPVVEPPEDVQAEAVKRADAQRGRFCGRFCAIRSVISPAALFEKVKRSIRRGSTPSSSRLSTRATSVRVFPVPGPA